MKSIHSLLLLGCMQLPLLYGSPDEPSSLQEPIIIDEEVRQEIKEAEKFLFSD